MELVNSNYAKVKNKKHKTSFSTPPLPFLLIPSREMHKYTLINPSIYSFYLFILHSKGGSMAQQVGSVVCCNYIRRAFHISPFHPFQMLLSIVA